MFLIEKKYTQEAHCCCDDTIDPALSLALMDGGGGYYLVVNAQQWAIGSQEDLTHFMTALQEMFAACAIADQADPPVCPIIEDRTP